MENGTLLVNLTSVNKKVRKVLNIPGLVPGSH